MSKKKNIIFVVSIGLFLAILFFFFKFILLPKIQYENTLKDPIILCLTLDVAHGCRNENYNEEELERYLKDDVLTIISLEEAEEVVINKKQMVIKERSVKNYDSESLEARRELENKKEQCEEYRKKSEDKAKEEGYISGDFSCSGSSGLDYISYLDKVLSVIQKIKND